MKDVACQAGEVSEAGGGVTGHTQQYGISAALACMADDDTSGHIVSNAEVATLAGELSERRHKDLVPLPFIAEAIAVALPRGAPL